MKTGTRPIRSGRWVLVLLLAAAAGWSCGDDSSATDDGGTDVEPEADVPPEADVEADAEPPEDAAGEDVGEEAEAEAVDPCAAYPCEPYGTSLGSVLEDWSLQAVNPAARAVGGEDDLVDMHDFYALTEAHGGTAKALLIYVTSVWCPYCAQEAARLNALYEELHPLGVEMLGLVLDGATPGEIATTLAARTYAMRHGWTFPTVVVSEELYDDLTDYWPPEDRASGEIGVPLHLLYDLREMRMYGRFAGAVQTNLLRYPLTEIVEDPQWTAPGRRLVSLDCAPGTGTETEPNLIGSSAEDGTSLPYALSGVQCPPVVGDGLFIDEDDVDLGTIEAGTVLDVKVTTGTGSGVYPFALFTRLAGTSLDLMHDAPWVMGSEANGRQFLVDQRGHYYLIVIDGRLRSSYYYGPDLEVPAADECCVGGPDHTYELAVSPFTLAVTDAAVAVGTSIPFTLDGGDLNVHPFDVTAATSYAVRMETADPDLLNPYLAVYDPAGPAVRGANDDEDAAAGNTNALVRVTPTADGTLWVVAGYTGASFREGPPSYVIRIE
ncbi:MAG: TlpA family protein disulfide reductase [Deltaproteobacteria bacterium]|nr:TlpA family protein disulfide reductase [Deltaproteobacteria bacterium]